MTRAAVTVFIETDHEGDARDAAEVFRQALRQNLGDSTYMSHPRMGEITVIIHDVMEAGVAAGNGYLWMEPTSKAFPRKEHRDA